MSDADRELLGRFVRERAEDAFAALVRRYLDLVYSAALRQVRTPQLAEEVVQSTFIDLARSAPRLAPDTVLASWLYRVATRTAVDVIRREARRQRREATAQELAAMNTPSAEWRELEPLLDQAMSALDEPERAAVLLRYFENQSLHEVGLALGVSEDAAQKRVARAVERLRQWLVRRGCTIGAGSLAGLIAAHAVQAAPGGLSAAVVSGAAAESAWATSTAISATKVVAMTTLQKTLVAGALAAALGVGLHQARQAAALRRELASVRHAAVPTATSAPDASPVPAVPAAAGPEAPAAFDWRRVESSDYRQYLANLRGVGCPEETIRDIIRADVGKLYEEKKKEVRRAAPKWDYWTSPQDFIRGAGRDMWMAMRDLDEDRDRVLRALGIEPDQRKRQAKRLNELDLVLDFLDEGKKNRALQAFNELEDRLANRDPGSLDAAGIERLLKERDDQVKAFLTPEEARQFELRTSSTARHLLHELAAFEPSKEEFEALFDLKKPYDDEFPAGAMGGLTAAEEARRAQAFEELQRKIRESLGPARYADYECSQDFVYEQVYRVTKEAGLGLPQARALYAVQQAAAGRAAQLERSADLDPAERARLAETARLEAEQAILGILGERGRTQLEQAGNPRWLNSLLTLPVSPRPTTP